MSTARLRTADVPYEVEVITVHGHRRAFVRVGAGPPLLLIHGIGNDLDSWGSVIPALARDFTVIAPDLLGHGRSDKPRADYSVAAYANGMRDLLSVLDVERATVVGHSLGGGVATQFAYQYPERCDRLVLVSTGGVSRGVHPALRLATAPAADAIMSVIGVPGVKPTVRLALALLSALGDDIAIDRAVVMKMLDGLGDATSRKALVRTLRAAVDLRGQVVTMLDRCYLAQGLPVLLIWGDRDAVIPLEQGRIAHAAMAGSRLEVFEGAGHFPHHSEPERFVELVQHFVESSSPARHDVESWRALLRTGRTGHTGVALPREPSMPRLLPDPEPA